MLQVRFSVTSDWPTIFTRTRAFFPAFDVY